VLTIDQLRLVLPSGFGPRAESIARRLGDELSRITVGASLRLERLDVAPVEIPHGASDVHVASSIAGAIRQGLRAAQTRENR
jgi:hypothetical protein